MKLFGTHFGFLNSLSLENDPQKWNATLFPISSPAFKNLLN